MESNNLIYNVVTINANPKKEGVLFEVKFGLDMKEGLTLFSSLLEDKDKNINHIKNSLNYILTNKDNDDDGLYEVLSNVGLKYNMENKLLIKIHNENCEKILNTTPLFYNAPKEIIEDIIVELNKLLDNI